MAYNVKITDRAVRDLVNLDEAIQVGESDAALRWYLGLRDVLRSLKEMPNRCPATPEGGELRHLLYGRKPHVYRVIYRVAERQKLVEVLHIRHGARQMFKAPDLK